MLYTLILTNNVNDLRKPIAFASVKVHCLITLICPIILVSHIAQLLLFRKFYYFRKVCIFPLNIHDIIIYAARWWEKYLLKHSLLKRTCLWLNTILYNYISDNPTFPTIFFYFCQNALMNGFKCFISVWTAGN